MLIEREPELAALRAVVARAAGGAGSATVLLGPPGIGKSALLDELAADVGEVQLLTGRGGELEQEFPYGVVRQLFEGALRAADDGTRAALLAGPARPAGALIGGESTDAPSDAPALEHAFYWLTVNLAERRPVVLLVDDAHWADLASLRTLVYLARRVAHHPVALVVATRPVDGTRRTFVERFAAEGQSLAPAALTEDGVGSLVHRQLSAADDAFCLACHSASGGNPFLVTELIGAIQASGIEPVEANANRVRTVGPHNVMRSVLLRLASLSPEATPVARALAVLDECRQIDVLAGIAGVPAGTATTAVDELRAAHIVAPDDPIRFVHSIVHSAVYDDIPGAQRSQLHGTAAHLVADSGSSPDSVAGHLLLTAPGSDPWVFGQLITAASSGLAPSTPEATAAYLDRALREAVVSGADRAPLLLWLGGSRFQTVEGGAAEPLTEAMALATEPRMRMEIGRALASVYMTENRYDDCWTLVDRLLEELSVHAELATELEVFAAQALYSDVDDGAAQVARTKAWQPRADGGSGPDRSMLAIQAWVEMCGPAGADITAAKARAALSTGTLVEDDTWYVTYEMAVWGLIGAGCYEEALASLDGAIASRRAVGQLLRAASLMVVRAEVRRRMGRVQLAEEDARFAVEVIPPEQIYAPQSASSLVFVLLERGRLDEARGVLAAHRFDATIPPGGVNDIAWLARGRLRIAEGDVAGGVGDVLHYGAISDKLGRRNPAYYPWRSTAAAALVQVGRRDEALVLAQEECALADAAGVPAARGRALSALGVAQHGDESVDTLRAGVRLLDNSPLVLDRAEAQLALGRGLRVSGKREQAREPLRDALDTATRIGAQALADRAQEELVASGARPRRQALHGLDALTPSELRVASLAAQGLTNRELAQTLYVTPKTIEAHLASAYRKLRIAGKTDLARALDLAQPAGR